jgi:hypothetical protein
MTLRLVSRLIVVTLVVVVGVIIIIHQHALTSSVAHPPVVPTPTISHQSLHALPDAVFMVRFLPGA